MALNCLTFFFFFLVDDSLIFGRASLEECNALQRCYRFIRVHLASS